MCNAVIQRGPSNPCPRTGAITYPATTLAQSHTHLNNPTQDPDGGLDDYGSLHSTGSNFLFADGSVHFLQETADDNPDGSYSGDSLIFQALGTRAGNETIPVDWLQ
jgi:prepilin-type processing-associated H-X9-DG protein